MLSGWHADIPANALREGEAEIIKEFNMEENAAAMQKVIAMTGRSIAPTTVIEKADGSEEVVVGLNLAKIAPAIA